jgi:hypothetical protein
MKKTVMTLTTVSAMIVLSSTFANADPTRLNDRSSTTQFQFGLEIDPDTSVVRILALNGRDVINPSFRLVSAICTDCGSGCPPMDREIEVVLEATEDVPGGYGVSNLATTRFSSTGVTYSTQGPLSGGPPGDQVTITFDGSVLVCGATFRLYFSMCDSEPSDPADPCPSGELETFTYVDSNPGRGDSGPDDSLLTFMQTVQPGVTSAHYIFVEIFRGAASGPPVPGAWCATGADQYVDQYVALVPGGGVWQSSGVTKWSRVEGGAWSPSDTAAYDNVYGIACGGGAYDWCSEWGVGEELHLAPFLTAFGEDCWAGGGCTGTGEVVTIRIAPTRMEACGF